MIIKVYSKDNCVQCSATERKLNKLGIPYVKLSALDNLPILKGMGYSQAPVVIKESNGHIVDSWSGYNPSKLKSLV